MVVDERHDIERHKWDAHAHHAAATQKPLPADATFESICQKDPLLTGVVEFLGGVSGKKVIELGCGLGKFSVLLARSGALVSASDISEGSVEVARRRAEEDGVADRIEFRVAAGEELPYEDGSFDLAFGKAVLHHIEPRRGGLELARVIRPGGRAAFSEPLGTNPIVRFARTALPYPGKHERGADIPLRRSDIESWSAPFQSLDLTGVQLTSMVERGFGFSRSIGPLRTFDAALLKRWPGLWPMCRYAVLKFER